jgi:putative RecB family exonuclease
LSCSFLYKLGRVDKLKPDFTPDALEFGTVIHKALGDFYNAKKAGHKLPLQELLDTFDHYWKETAEGRSDIKYKEGDSYNTLLTKGKELLKTYYENLPDDNYRVLAVEEPFSFKVAGIPIPIIGAIDLLEMDSDSTIIVTDFKTAGKSYSTEPDDSFQLTVYNMAMKGNGYKDKEILLRFDVLVKTKIPKFEQHYTVRDETHEKKAIKTIQMAWEGISKGVFIPNAEAWKCKGCSYKSHCEKELGN